MNRIRPHVDNENDMDEEPRRQESRREKFSTSMHDWFRKRSTSCGCDSSNKVAVQVSERIFLSFSTFEPACSQSENSRPHGESLAKSCFWKQRKVNAQKVPYIDNGKPHESTI
ncbi:hypothetical protein BC937DRAFT_94119 [Endogone sp. FLAS-F59071]|nr:hypothetical protein BC937DRAFT_94119 [Endogone sp. FLAS-F59071]|eukprot:RUS22999.1 hypothetical protein BC937DRAFT_94119 [Endogone sp. FLAS-F59071]